MLGEQTVKVQDKLEPELKKFLETIISETGKSTIEKTNFEEVEKGSIYDVFGNKAKYRINDIVKIKHKDHSLFYTVNIYYPEDIESKEWTEQHRKEMFFAISFTEDSKDNDRYYIVVNSADSKNFANYEVVVYKASSGNYIRRVNKVARKVAYYFISALTEREEYQFIDGLMETVKEIARYDVSTKNNEPDHKQEFLSIISDAINTGN
nr:MAG TPA: hypothetical protein [Caudoviricetes sp.]